LTEKGTIEVGQMIYKSKMGLRMADMDFGKVHTEVPRRTCLICGKVIPRVIHNDGTFLWWGAHICEPGVISVL